MLLWALGIQLLVQGFRLLASDLAPAASAMGLGRERAELLSVVASLRELEESLSAGLVPEQARWDRLRGLPAPWGELSHPSIQELRARGAAVLPTLRRLRTLAQEHLAALGEARARSAQALAQAGACALLVPLFGGSLYALLPAVSDRPIAWAAACSLALLAAGAGALWMLAIADQACWAGLSASARPWPLAAQCAGERFLALVRSGSPADLAWSGACALLEKEAPELALEWGYSIWDAGDPPARGGAAARALIGAGGSIRKAVQVSLMEGKPCTERVETALLQLRQELKALVEREMSLLSTRALKPLFACVAPSLLGLLAAGLWISWESGFA